MYESHNYGKPDMSTYRDDGCATLQAPVTPSVLKKSNISLFFCKQFSARSLIKSRNGFFWYNKVHMRKILLLLVLIDIFILTAAGRVRPQPETAAVPGPVHTPVAYTAPNSQPVTAGYWRYYDQLSKEEQDTYRILYQGLSAFRETIDFPFVSDLSFIRSNIALKMDHPELWFAAEPVYYMQGASVFRAEYKIEADTEDIFRQIERETDLIVSRIPAGSGDYEKALYLFKWLCENVTYNEHAVEAGQDVRSVFLEHRPVCGGIAAAFTLLAGKAGIPCLTVCGTAADGGRQISHAWNELFIDGSWTWADATWGNQKDWINMLEFGMDDAEALSVRTISTSAGADVLPAGAFTYPEADSRNKWCAHAGCLFDAYDRESATAYFKEKLAGPEGRIYMQFTDLEAYEAAKQDLYGSDNDMNAYFHTIVHDSFGEYRPWYFTDLPDKKALIFLVR